MKKMFKRITLLIIVMFIGGCTLNTADPVIVDKSLSILSRHIGNGLQQDYPDTAKKVRNACIAISTIIKEDQPLSIIIINKFIDCLLSEKIDNPLLVWDIKDLVGMMQPNLDIDYLNEIQTQTIKTITENLLLGIEWESVWWTVKDCPPRSEVIDE
ncbi:hypothetical protein KAR91_74945 [Candidatus Pacearchaeota archaeon]|nr:hypothetical protein [Candidatus Pacearchaeota archaeon]